MLGHPSSENDIKARAAVLAEAILSTNPHSDAFLKVRDEFRQELAGVALPAERMTFFAMERVAARAGIHAVWLEGPLLFVPNGALVVISPNMPAPTPDSGTVRMLERAAFVVAPASWKAALDGAKIAGLAIDEGSAAESAEPRKLKP